MASNKAIRGSAFLLLTILFFGLPAMYMYKQIPLKLYPYSLVSPGWEIYDQIGAIECNDQIYSQAAQFTSPRELKGVYWKVDVDDPDCSVPTLMIEIGDIHHVDFTGRDTPNDQPASTLTFTRGNYSYYLDYHIYLYTVTVRTVADKIMYQSGNVLVPPSFKHETSFPYEWWNGIWGGGGTTYVGKKFQGGVYTKFVISPWKGGTYRNPPNASYILDKCWAGVMNTYILSRKMGQIENNWGTMPEPDRQAQMWVKASLDVGNQVPMFVDDGSFGTPAPTVNWDPTVTPDTRISSTVVQYMPMEMLAGAKLNLDAFGLMQDMYPCDVYIQYSYRIDVLQVHDFVLKTAVNPPWPQTPQDYVTWSMGWWEGFFAGIGNWFANPLNSLWFIFIAIIMAVLVLAVFAPSVLLVIIGSFKTRHKEKT